MAFVQMLMNLIDYISANHSKNYAQKLELIVVFHNLDHPERVLHKCLLEFRDKESENNVVNVNETSRVSHWAIERVEVRIVPFALFKCTDLLPVAG